MNRTMLIVIVDFLLISLLAFSTADINKVTENTMARQVRVDLSTNQADAGRDLAAVMRQALEDEQKNRDLLMGELASVRETASRQETLLGERDRQVQTARQELTAKQQETQRLEEQQKGLQQQFAMSQTNIQQLTELLKGTSAEATASREKIAEMESELRKQAEALRQQLAHLARTNEMVLAEKQRLASELQVAEVEKRHAADQVAAMQQRVEAEREEKAKLAEGVQSLASKSGELVQEIRENRPLAPNAIFNEFLASRIWTHFTASRSSLLGTESVKHKDTETVLVSDGTRTFALCHVDDTPLTFWSPGTEWEGLSGSLKHGSNQVPVRSISFHRRDPRVVLLPLTNEDTNKLATKVYRVSGDPYKFQDAVLVGAREGYYGECKFEIDTTTPGYVKLDRSFLRGIFGKFNPTRGDLVFSRTGELLGVMANGTYCMMLQNFEAAATVQFGQDVRNQRTGVLLSRLYTTVSQLPYKLQ
jgi:hypothetical protein